MAYRMRPGKTPTRPPPRLPRGADAEVRRLTRLYAALSQCNKAIVRCGGENELFPEICRAAVRFGGMRMAWVGMIDGGSRMVRPVASFGDDRGYLKDIAVSLDPDSPFGGGPTSIAIRANRPYWCQDFQHDPATAPWRARGARWGALAALPLCRGGAVDGAFVLYADAPGSFDSRERDLLEEMADDVSFALDNFAHERERLRAESSLRAAEAMFHGLVDQSIAGIFIIQNGRLSYVNQRYAEIAGQSAPDSMIGTDPLRWVAADDRERVAENLLRMAGGEVRTLPFEFAVLRPDGGVVEVGSNIARVMQDGRLITVGMLQDISERKRAASEVRRSVQELKNALLRTAEVAMVLSAKRDPYTADHARRVAEIAVAIGAELGFDTARQEGLRIAGCLHDIGKIAVPSEILSKPGRLSAIEFQLIKVHAQAGHDVLKEAEFPWCVADVALQHHERMDGSGYPHGLAGEAILPEARIMAVADVVEAISSHRPYRAALGIEKALAEIERGRGTVYDTDAAAAGLRLFHEKGFSVPV